MFFEQSQLLCPACNADLSINPKSQQVICKQCGNLFILKDSSGQIDGSSLVSLVPKKYTPSSSGEWMYAGVYAVKVHEIRYELDGRMRFIFVDVEYRNLGQEPINCRVNQWTIYDVDGYTYDSAYGTFLFNNWPGKPLRGGDLSPSANKRGWLVFKLPRPDVVLSRLQFINSIFNTLTVEFYF